MNNQKPRVTICCVTYNQVKYIRQALESFVNQKTNFPFIAIVGDDCSTDGTTEIVKEYAQKYPNIIKPVFREKNLGGHDNFCDIINRAESEYIALCEGDDYWIDNLKLQKQFDLLEKNKNCTICFNKTLYKFEDKSKKDYIFPKNRILKNKKILSFSDLLKRNFIQTNSVMYRWQLKDCDIFKVFPGDIMPGDWYLHLLHAKKGDILVLDDVMSVYRINPNGTWHDSFKNKEALHLRYGIEELRFFKTAVNSFGLDFNSYIKNVENTITEIISTYCQNFCIDKMQKIKEEFPDFINTYKQNIFKRNNKLSQKLKRYKFIVKLLVLIIILILIMILGGIK